ncbi:MAG: hypothetical protein IJL88_00385 [Clostridia bacterium]|nr:hypothetical protein [Clostridia bacterium]
MKRFFRYSLEHNRAIRMIFVTENGTIRQVNAVVEEMNEEHLSIYILRPPQRLVLSCTDVLSCDYVRNDEGLE